MGAVRQHLFESLLQSKRHSNKINLKRKQLLIEKIITQKEQQNFQI
jgi:hypothetical protein